MKPGGRDKIENKIKKNISSLKEKGLA